jgi:hypothetical protein
MPLEPIKHVNGRMWHPGQSGNPNGRPVGSRTVFSQAFCHDLAEVWSEEGREAIVNHGQSNCSDTDLPNSTACCSAERTS